MYAAPGKSLLFSYDANGQAVSVNYNGTEYYYLRNGQNDIVGLMDESGVRVVERPSVYHSSAAVKYKIKAPKADAFGAFGLPGAIRTRGLSLRSYATAFLQRYAQC